MNTKELNCQMENLINNSEALRISDILSLSEKLDKIIEDYCSVTIRK